MKKILLVIDDYPELEFLESLLRRLGFDILSLSKDVSVTSSILGFFPDLVIAQAKSRSVDGVALSQKIKKVAPQAGMVLLHPVGLDPKLTPENRKSVDAFLESPVDANQLIYLLSQLGNFDEQTLKDKFNRIASSVKQKNSSQFVSGGKTTEEKTTIQGGGSSAAQPSARQKRYGEFLSKHKDPVDRVISAADMKAATTKLKEASKADEDFSEAKKEFVRALFKK